MEGRKLHKTGFCWRLQFSKGKNSYPAGTNAGGRHLISFVLRAEVSIGLWLPKFLQNQLWVGRERRKVALAIFSIRP